MPPAGYIAFISAAPVLDPILFGALWLIVGPTVAIIYFVVTFVAAASLALASQHLGVERHLKPVAEMAAMPSLELVGGAGGDGGDGDGDGGNGGPEGGSCGGPQQAWAGWSIESREALRSSTALLRSFGPLLLLGVAIGIAIEAVVSPEAAASVTTGQPWIAIPTAAALGTPLYFSTGLFVPIANSLSNAGVGIGAIVALTIAGAGANLPEFVILSKMARPGAVGVFFSYVFAIAMTGGALAHILAG